jgi:hypothetical protein
MSVDGAQPQYSLSGQARAFAPGMYLDMPQQASVPEKWASGATRWLGRVWAGQTGDTFVGKLAESGKIPPTPKIQLKEPAIKPLGLMAKGSLGWEHLLGWNTQTPDPKTAAYAKRNWANYRRYVSKRFNAPQTTVAQAGGLRRVIPQLISNNFKGLVTALEQGKWLTAGSTMLGMGLFGIGIAKETKDNYDRAVRDEQHGGADRFSTLAKTAASFGKAVGKAVVAWEAGTIGFKAGAILGGPLGAVAGTVAGVGIGSLASLGTKLLLDGADHAAFGNPQDDLIA